jgi:hypothetical protein
MTEMANEVRTRVLQDWGMVVKFLEVAIMMYRFGL